MGQNKTKNRAGKRKATRQEDNVIRVTSLSDLRLTTTNTTTQQSQCRKKCFNLYWQEKTL